MPIDAAIPLDAQGTPPLVNPMQIYGQAQQMQLARQQAAALEEQRQSMAQERAQQTAKLAQQNADTQAFADSIRQGNGVRQATMDYATKNHPGLVPELQKYFDAADESADKIKKSQAELQNMQLDHLGHTADWLLTHASDPALLPGAIGMALAHHAELFPNEAAQVQQIGQQLHGMSPDQQKQFLEQTRAAAPYYQGEQSKIAEKGPTIVPEGAIAINPSGQTIATGAPKPTNLEQKSGMLNGKEITYSYDPHTGKSAYQGQDVTDQVKPMPPAAMRVTIGGQGTQLPDFAMTDARPSGADANKPDPTIRMTPNGLHQAALNYIANGQYPPTGRGSDPISVAQREAINSKVGAISAASGMDVPTLRAFYKSNSSSLTQMQKSADSVQSFMATADKNAALLEQTLKRIPDVGSPLLNKPLRAIEQNALGNVDLAQFKTYLQSVQNEYARILSQPNLSGQLTDSARKEAEQLVNPNATVPQIVGSIRALNSEGQNRIVSLGEQIQRIQQRMQTGPGQAAPASAGSAPAATAPATPAASATTESAEHRVWRLTGKQGPEPK